MTRPLLIPLIALLLLVSSGVFVQTAHAQVAAGASCSPDAVMPADNCVDGYYCSNYTNTCAPNSQLSADAAKAQASVPNTPMPFGKDTTPDVKMFGGIMQWIASLFAWLLGVAALTLNAAVYYTVIAMGTFVKELTAVGVTWRIMRDIGNIVLIFGFLAIGITIIINTDMYGWGKKMLPKLLLAAVFLNFSLLAASAVIDVGNLFATQFYTQINGGMPATPMGSISMDAVKNEGISNKVMAQLGMQGLYGDAKVNSKLFEGNSPALIGMLSIILFIVAAFVFFSLAFILIARFVMLLFLIITSPIGFAGLAVPKLEGLAKDWWSKLFEQTITAPVLMLLLYVALAVITDASFLTGFGGTNGSNTGFWTGIIAGTPNVQGFMSMFLSFLVAMGLLLAVVIASKKMSAFGASGAMSLAGKATFGATAWGMNRTLGRASYYAGRGLRQSKGFNKFDAWTGRAASRLLDKGATGSFDVRGTKAFGSLPFGGIDAGKVAEGGFTGAQKRSVEDHEKAVKAIETAYKEKGSKRFEGQIADERATALKKAQGERDEAQGAKDKAKAEVNRISRLPETNEQTLAQLQKAEQELATADKRLATAANGLASANEEMKKDIEKAAGDRMSQKIRDSKRAYATGIDHPIGLINPFQLVGFGPGSGLAARKIKESLKEKSTKDKAYEAMKKALEETEKSERDEQPRAETPPKPAPSTPPTAPTS